MFDPYKIKNFFIAKDAISNLSRSLVVYKFSCAGCSACYVGVWKSRNPESGIRNRSRKRKRNLNLNWDQGKLWSTKTSSRYPCGNKIQDGVVCYHWFYKFLAQWSWYQRYTHIRKVTCKKKGKCILLLFLAVINCDCSCKSSNFRQIETTTNHKPIDCEKQPLLVCDV